MSINYSKIFLITLLGTTITTFPFNYHYLLYSEVLAQTVKNINQNKLKILLNENGNLSETDQKTESNLIFDVYSLELKEDQSVTIIIKSSEFTPNLTVMDSNDQIIFQKTSNRVYVNRTTQSLNKNERYRIYVSGKSKGQYSIIARTTHSQDLENIKIDEEYEQGLINWRQGNTDKGLNLILKALKSYEKLNDIDGQIACLSILPFMGNIGSIEQIQYQQRRLQIARTIQDQSQEAISLGQIANFYKSLGQYAEAVNYYEQSLTIHKKSKNLNGQAGTFGTLGLMYQNLGQEQKGIIYFQEALKIYQELGNIEAVSLTKASIASSYLNQQRFQDAIELCQPVVQEQSIFSSLICLKTLAKSHSSLEQYSEAIKYSQLAIALAQKQNLQSEIADISNTIGDIYANQEMYNEAINNFNKAKEIAKLLKIVPIEVESLRSLGLIYFLQKQFIQGEKLLRESISIAENFRSDLSDLNKISLIDTQTNSYLLLQKILIAQNKNLEALEISERGRTRALIELLAAKNSAQPKIDPLTIPQIQQIAKEQQATLVEYSLIPEDKLLYIWVVKPTGEIIFKQVEFQLPENLDLKDPKTLNRGMLQWIETNRSNIGINRSSNPQQLIYQQGDFVTLTNNEGFTKPWQVEVVNLNTKTLTLTNPDYNEGKETLDVSFDEVKEKLANYTDTKENLQKLYQQLITPIESHLPTNPDDKVIFIPHGELFLIPFVALQDSQGKYLIEKHTILTAPSIQVLQFTRQNRNNLPKTQNPSALVVGNPIMPTIPLVEPPQPLLPLSGAEKEAQAVSNLLSTKALIGKEATKTTIVQKMPEANLIHLATHGLLDDIRQLGYPGAIALTPTAEDNGFLTSGELINMKLKADLVVLSACNTGGGKISGDGVIGLSRSLISAGVPSVIVSLWSVPDAPTAELMTEFYHNYLVKKMNKAQALKVAMLTTKAKHPNPVDWAGFTIIGSAD